MKKKIVLTLALCAFLLLMGCSNGASDGSPTGNMVSKAPSFQATTIDGKNVSLDYYMESDKPLLVYFTASWCPICAKNWPSLDTVYKEYNDSVNFVAISIDPTDTKKVLKGLEEKHNLSYPMVPGSPEIMKDFGVKSQATTVGVNANGTIKFVKEKQVISVEEYRNLIDRLLEDG